METKSNKGIVVLLAIIMVVLVLGIVFLIFQNNELKKGMTTKVNSSKTTELKDNTASSGGKVIWTNEEEYAKKDSNYRNKYVLSFDNDKLYLNNALVLSDIKEMIDIKKGGNYCEGNRHFYFLTNYGTVSDIDVDLLSCGNSFVLNNGINGLTDINDIYANGNEAYAKDKNGKESSLGIVSNTSSTTQENIIKTRVCAGTYSGTAVLSDNKTKGTLTIVLRSDGSYELKKENMNGDLGTYTIIDNTLLLKTKSSTCGPNENCSKYTEYLSISSDCSSISDGYGSYFFDPNFTLNKQR